jgi:hypothetical protein
VIATFVTRHSRDWQMSRATVSIGIPRQAGSLVLLAVGLSLNGQSIASTSRVTHDAAHELTPLRAVAAPEVLPRHVSTVGELVSSHHYCCLTRYSFRTLKPTSERLGLDVWIRRLPFRGVPP